MIQATHSANSTRPTVCQLVHSLNVGGAEILAARIARTLQDRYRFVFVCLDELGVMGDTLRREGFAVHVLERRPGVDWRCAARLASLLREERVDLVHAHQYTPFAQGLLGRVVGRGPAILLTEHGRHFPDVRKRKRVMFNRLLLGRRDRMIGVGQSVRQALIDNEGLPAARVEVLYNGVNLQPYLDLNADDRTAARRELGVHDHELAVLLVARLNTLKDHATAIRMAARLVACGRSVRLLFAGEGEERDQLEQLVAAYGLRQTVRFLGLRRDIPQLFAAADVGLLTSISEGIPLTVIEAMAAGKPVVATRVGGLTEMIEHGRTGLLAPVGDAVALADCVAKLQDDPARREAIGQAGLVLAVERFSETTMLDGYDRHYREMIR